MKTELNQINKGCKIQTRQSAKRVKGLLHIILRQQAGFFPFVGFGADETTRALTLTPPVQEIIVLKSDLPSEFLM